jgi:hypothetical protein
MNKRQGDLSCYSTQKEAKKGFEKIRKNKKNENFGTVLKKRDSNHIQNRYKYNYRLYS